MSDKRHEIKLARAQARVATLERMIEDKTRELFFANEQLRERHAQLLELYLVMPGALITYDADGFVQEVNQATSHLLGYTQAELVRCHISSIMNDVSFPRELERYETEWMTKQGSTIPVLISAAPMLAGAAGVCSIVCVGVDLTARKHLEVELRHAQKLESVGQLAAGIAHEINTPMQFIGDNVTFLQDAFKDLLSLTDACAGLLQQAGDNASLDALEHAIRNADLMYVRERGPRAFERTLAGVQRVSRIIGALKAFSHPSPTKGPMDLNQTVENALTVAKSEYRYVADIDWQAGDVPAVTCHESDIMQVVINIIVNAAHAIADVQRDSFGLRGTITLRTFRENDQVVLSVADTGAGIPESIRHRIYDPFFTTKEVGRGTGQGLAIAHNIIVEKEGGSLSFDTVVGQGTTFYVRLPVAQTRCAEAAE